MCFPRGKREGPWNVRIKGHTLSMALRGRGKPDYSIAEKSALTLLTEIPNRYDIIEMFESDKYGSKNNLDGNRPSREQHRC